MRFSKLVLPGITMIATTYGLARFSYGLLLPNINHDLQMSSSVSGFISSLFYLAYCFTIILSTIFTIDKGPRIMILAAGISAFIGLFIIGASPNIWFLGLGVLFAGASTGLASPPYGAAISLWIEEKKQGKANTWINSGTSIGIALTGVGALILASEWRLTYFIYAAIALITLLWNAKILPHFDSRSGSDVTFVKEKFAFKDIKGVKPLIVCSTFLGISTAAFWTFSIDFIKNTGSYQDWQLPLFWIIIGIFGIIGGLSGTFIERFGLPLAYKWASLAISFASLLLVLSPERWFVTYSSAALFGITYIFITGVLMVWGIRVFITNASLGIGMPFLLLALGQVIGSLLAGISIDLIGFSLTFIISGIMGMIAMILGPKKII